VQFLLHVRCGSSPKAPAPVRTKFPPEWANRLCCKRVSTDRHCLYPYVVSGLVRAQPADADTPTRLKSVTCATTIDFCDRNGIMETSRVQTLSRRIKLPPPVAAIYRAVAELEARYPRKFTPDGHLVGSIGEVLAAEALGLTLYPMLRAGHDAYDADGDVQIKMTGGRSIAIYAECVRLVVLRVVSPEEAEIVYDGPGAPAWANAGNIQKNGQRVVSLAKLRALTTQADLANTQKRRSSAATARQEAE